MSDAAAAPLPGNGLTHTKSTARDELGDVLDLLTHRLKVDPELRLGVRQELRSHLEESIEQLRLGGGRSEADARAEAVAALGDPQALSMSLWQANRRRIRLRATAAWGSRLLLPPIAVALLLFLAHNGAMTMSMAYLTLGPEPSWWWVPPPPVSRQMAEGYRDQLLGAAPAHVQALFRSDRTMLREQAQLRPDDKALYAQYAAVVSVWLLSSPYHQSDLARTDPAALSEGLAVFAEGERREPDNALYPFLTAAALLDATVTEDWDKSLIVHRPSRSGEDNNWDWCRLQVSDPARFAAGLEAFARAARKPYFHTYGNEVRRRKLSAIPTRRLADLLLRLRQDNPTTGVMTYYLWQAAGHIAYAATDAARAGRADQAWALLRDLRSIQALTAPDYANTWDSVFSSEALPEQAEARIRAALGDAAGAEAAWKKADELVNAPPRSASNPAPAAPAAVDKARAGILYSTLMRWQQWSGRGVDFAPMRRAEYALADEVGVAAVSVAVLTLAALYAIRALASWVRRWRRRGNEGDPGALRLTLGWRRIGSIVVLAVVAPMFAYFAYARLTPLSGRGWGLNVQLRRVAIEYTLLGVTILMLLNYLARRAVRARAAELGLGLGLSVAPLGDRARPSHRTVLAAAATLLAMLSLASVIAVTFGSGGLLLAGMHRMHSTLALVLLVMSWLLLGIAVMTLRSGREPRDRRDNGFADSLLPGVVARTAFPIAVVAAIVVGITGFPLHWVESHAVKQAMAQQGAPLSEQR